MIAPKVLIAICILICSFVDRSLGFSECTNSGIADPFISGVTDCPSWLAYLQSTGQNIANWCSTTGARKCCNTCKNIIDNCVDRAYTPDCQIKLAQGLCTNPLADLNTVQFYCRKTCGFCSSLASLACNILSQTCGSGTCTPVTLFGVSTVRCTCPANLAGAYCQRTNPCLSSPCSNNGLCLPTMDEDTTYTCQCPPGFSGSNCQISSSPCASSPCRNGGTCTTVANGYICTCQANFFGNNCDTFQINSCLSSPCRNGGTCTQVGNNYFCTCPLNFFGNNCESIQSTGCASNPCTNNGLCIALSGGGYSCSCLPGFTGTNCQLSSGCASNPCQNGAVCTNLASGYFCSCLQGYTGTNCQILNPCFSNPCSNGGFCSNSGSSYFCSCTFGFTGANCQFSNACATNPCSNGGACSVNNLGQAVCTCLPGFTGLNCQTSSNCGVVGGCQNGGTCSLRGTSFECLCPANVYGRNCEYVVTSQICTTGDRSSLYCPIWSAFNFCQWLYTYNSVPVPIYCPTSCNVCRSVSSCIDSQPNCVFWSNLNLCSLVNSRDPNLCKKSCGLCGNLIK